MKRIKFSLSLFACAVCALGLNACSQKQDHVDVGDLKTLEDSVSYAIGLSSGVGMKAQISELNPEIFARAFRQGFAGDTAGIMSQEQMREVMQKYDEKLRAANMAKMKQEAIPYRKAAEEFLAKNKNEKGVVTTASGLQYRVVKEGNGIKPTSDDDRIRYQYSLSLLDKDGKVSEPIEDTFTRGGEPVITSLNGLIPGMSEGFRLMKAGSIYEFWIHPDLAYGDMGGAGLPPGSMLVFRMELVEVLPAQTK